ncbi:MAG: hypothetical protein PHT54_04840 [Candidatus Nanoarchaeia archaeon]|nr:hypothetical protein [Candidatus Nanoarchaeia archaeon]
MEKHFKFISFKFISFNKYCLNELIEELNRILYPRRFKKGRKISGGILERIREGETWWWASIKELKKIKIFKMQIPFRWIEVAEFIATTEHEFPEIEIKLKKKETESEKSFKEKMKIEDAIRRAIKRVGIPTIKKIERFRKTNIRLVYRRRKETRVITNIKRA